MTASICEFSFFHTILIQHRSDRGFIVNWSPSASSSASYEYNTSSDRSSIVDWSQTASSSIVLYRISFVFVLFLPLPNLVQRRSDRGSIINWTPSASSSAIGTRSHIGPWPAQLKHKDPCLECLSWDGTYTHTPKQHTVLMTWLYQHMEYAKCL